MPSHAHASAIEHDELMHIVTVRGERSPQRFDLSLRVAGWKPEEDHPVVLELIAEHQIAEVLVVRDDRTLLGPRDRENFMISPRRWIVVCYRGHVVPAVSQEGSYPEFSALIEKELHMPVAAAGRSVRRRRFANRLFSTVS